MNWKTALLVGLILGLVIGAYWMHAHLTCPVCQSKWTAWKRWLGMRILPND